MSEPVAETAMTTLVSLLGEITAENVRTPVVLRELRHPEQINEWPTICVKEDDGSETETVEWLETAGQEAMVAERFNVVLYLHVIGDASTKTSTALIRLREAVREKLFANYSLGGIARGIAFGREEVDGGLLEPRGLWVLPLSLLLDHKYVTD